MAKILVMEHDSNTTKTIKDILASRDNHTVQLTQLVQGAESSLASPTNHCIFHAPDLKAALTFLASTPFDLFFVDTTYIDTRPNEWLKKIKDQIKLQENKAIPTAFISHKEEDSKVVRKFLDSGMMDFFFSHFDWPVFLQKFDLIITKQNSSANKQLYSLKISNPIDYATVKHVEEMSEFGITIRSKTPIVVNEFAIFHGEYFAEDGSSGEIVGRCYSSIPHPAVKGEHQSSFVFVGVTPLALQSIRKWLRHEYARKKQQEAA